jgi:hypothetical protein
MNELIFPHNDEYQQKLEANIIQIFQKIKYDPTAYDQINDLYTKNYQSKDGKIKISPVAPILIIKIKDGLLKFVGDYDPNRSLEQDIIHMFEDTIEWAIEHDFPVPDTNLYIYCNDRPCYYVDNLPTIFPLFCIARTNLRLFPLIPDSNFNNFFLKKKYGQENLSWDKTKKVISKKLSPKKKNIMYFKGTITGQYRTDLRRLLAEKVKKPNRVIIINLDAWNSFSPIYDFSQYKLLLNLPGHADWSVRFKYLFLLKSVVVNVDVVQEFENSVTRTFIDLIVIPDVDYVNVEYKYYLDKTNTEKSVNSLCKKLNHIYTDVVRNYDNYSDMIESGYNKVNELTESRVFQYSYKMVLMNDMVMNGIPIH